MKKAIIFSLSLLLIAIAALVGIILIVSKLEGIIAGSSFIGSASDALLKTFADQQTVSLEVNQIAKYALVDALINTRPCEASTKIEENNEQYTLWDSTCYKTLPPDDLLKQRFVESFNSQYSLVSADGTRLSGDDFDYFIDPKPLTVHGIAQKSFLLPIKLGEVPSGMLAFRPSFKVTLHYDFTIYDTLFSFADTVLASCPSAEDKRACITTAKSVIPAAYTVELAGVDGDNYFFAANTEQRFENPYTGEALPPVRFALNLGVRE